MAFESEAPYPAAMSREISSARSFMADSSSFVWRSCATVSGYRSCIPIQSVQARGAGCNRVVSELCVDRKFERPRPGPGLELVWHAAKSQVARFGLFLLPLLM